jgi:hypothetical protein
MRKKNIREELFYQIGQDSSIYSSPITNPSFIASRIDPNKFSFNFSSPNTGDTFTPAKPTAQIYSSLRIGNTDADKVTPSGNIGANKFNFKTTPETGDLKTGTTGSFSFDLNSITKTSNSTSVDQTIAFRETLSKNPLIEQSAQNILENGFISTNRNSKSTIKETIDLIKGDTSFDYMASRKSTYDTKNIKSPSKQNYYTALLDQHLTRDILAGVVFKGTNDFTKDLGEKYTNDLSTLNRDEVSSRERYRAMAEKIKSKTGEDLLNIITKDIIAKAGEIKVQERNKDGEILKTDGKPKEIIITAENFERYLDDSTVQKAIEKEVNKRTYYQNNNYRTVIDNYRAINPDAAPIENKSEKSKTTLPEATKTEFNKLNQAITKKLRTVKDNDKTLDLLTGSSSTSNLQGYKGITNKERDERKGWGDYKEIKWDGSTHGSIFADENKKLIDELYSNNIEKGTSVKHLDQFSALMTTLIDKGTKGTLTNQEVSFLKKITIDNDWKPQGDTSKKLATEIIKVLGSSNLQWQ